MIASNGIFYSAQGNGERALVFLHYFGSSGATWTGIINQLSSDTRCIAPDFRGFGRSRAPTSLPGVTAYADDIQHLIEELALERYVLVGHSMGGKVAMALAARKLPGLESLLLLAPSPPTPEPISSKDRAALRQMFGISETIKAHLNSITARPLEDAVLAREATLQLRADKTAWQAWLDTGSREDISGAVNGLSIPALVLAGSADTGITPALLDAEVVSRFPASRLETIPGAGHLIHLEQEVALVAAIRAWTASFPAG